VLATGPGFKDKKGNAIPVSVTVGDKVLLPQFGGTTVKVGDDVSYNSSVEIDLLTDRKSHRITSCSEIARFWRSSQNKGSTQYNPPKKNIHDLCTNKAAA